MTDDPPVCPYGQSGDTCVPIMYDYPCICALKDENAAIRRHLEAVLNIAGNHIDGYDSGSPELEAFNAAADYLSDARRSP